MGNEDVKEKKPKKKLSPVQTIICILCVILCFCAIGGVAANGGVKWIKGKNGKNGESETVHTETVREYVQEYLSSPDGSAQIKTLTRDDIEEYTNALVEYFQSQGVNPTSSLTTIEQQLIDQLTEEMMAKLDRSELERMVDVAVAAYLKDYNLSKGNGSASADYSALIDELRSKYESRISELEDALSQLQQTFDAVNTYVNGNAASLTDLKLLEQMVNQLKQQISTLESENNSLTQVTNVFDTTLNELKETQTNNYNELSEMLSQTSMEISSLYESLTQDINTLTELFGEQLTQTYDELNKYIENVQFLQEQSDLEIIQNLEQTAMDICNTMDANDTQLQNNINILDARVSKEVYDLNQRVTEEVNQLNTQLGDLRDYVNGYVTDEINKLYETIYNQYEWSKDANGQDKLTITTPAPLTTTTPVTPEESSTE